MVQPTKSNNKHKVMGKWYINGNSYFPLRGIRYIWKHWKNKYIFVNSSRLMLIFTKCSLWIKWALMLFCWSIHRLHQAAFKQQRSRCERISARYQHTGGRFNHGTGLLSTDKTANRTWRSELSPYIPPLTRTRMWLFLFSWHIWENLSWTNGGKKEIN